MKLSCPSCGAKYSIADEKVHDRLAKIRCRKCSATIIIDGKVEPPNVYTSDTQHGATAPDAGGDAMGGAPTDVGPGEYSVDFGDQDQRTMSVAQIIQAYNAGQISADTFVWTEGMGDWVPISQVPEISGMLNAAAAVSAPRISDAPKRVSEPPRAAARTGAGRGSATDLFGGIETAGSEEDVQTSAPHAPPAAAPMGGGATGARNESSVLFSLSALTASAGPPFGAPAPTVSSASSPSKTSDSAVKAEEDSGLIDLKALTASSGADMPASPLMATAPLGLAAPLGGVTAAPRMMISDDDIAPRQSGSKAGIFIGMGIFAAALVVGGAILASGGGEEKDKPADIPIAAATPLPTPTPTPTQTVTATPPATGTAQEEAKKEEAKPTASRRSYRPRSKKGAAPAEQEVETKSSTPTTSDEPAPKKKPKSKASCESQCGPADLMCAMRCAAK